LKETYVLRAYPKSVVTYCNFPLAKCKTGTDARIFRPIVTFQYALLTFRIGSESGVKFIFGTKIDMLFQD